MTRKRFEVTAICYDKRGRAISVGKNDYSKSHPLMKHFAEIAEEPSEKIYKHAELDALLKARGQDVHSVMVQRFDSKGSPRLAKPCKTCREILKGFGVKVVNYTTEEGVKTYESTC